MDQIPSNLDILPRPRVIQRERADATLECREKGIRIAEDGEMTSTGQLKQRLGRRLDFVNVRCNSGRCSQHILTGLDPVQRAVLAIACTAGFQPVGPAWIRRLRTLRGEFRRSMSECVFWYVFEGLAVGCGVWLVSFCVRDYLIWRLTEWPIGVMGAAILGMGLFAITRNGRWYRLEHAMLTAVRHNGQVAWQESLEGLESVMVTRGRGGLVSTLILRWPGHVRRLELYRSLETALASGDPND